MKPGSRKASLSVVAIAIALTAAACGGGEAAAPSIPAATASAGALQDLSSLSAEEREDRFITAVGGVIGGMSRGGITSLGQRACGAFEEGSSVDDVRSIFVTKGLTEAQAQKVLLAAVATMCPEYAKMVNP